MLTFTLIQPREPWRDSFVIGHGIKLQYQAENPFNMTARVLRHQGANNNGPIRFSRKDGFCAEFPSLAALCDSPAYYGSAPLPVHPYLYSALAQAPRFTRRSAIYDLVARDMLDSSTMQLTASGQEAKIRYEVGLAAEKEFETSRKIYLTPKQIEALDVVQNHPRLWGTLHGKTQNYLLRQGWVVLDGDTPSLSESGKALMDNPVTEGEQPWPK